MKDYFDVEHPELKSSKGGFYEPNFKDMGVMHPSQKLFGSNDKQYYRCSGRRY